MPTLQPIFRLEAKGVPVLACCTDDGHALEFDTDTVMRLPAAGLQALIAHELGHVVQHMNGWPLDEHDADQRAERWGFAWQAQWDALLAP